MVLASSPLSERFPFEVCVVPAVLDCGVRYLGTKRRKKFQKIEQKMVLPVAIRNNTRSKLINYHSSILEKVPVLLISLEVMCVAWDLPTLDDLKKVSQPRKQQVVLDGFELTTHQQSYDCKSGALPPHPRPSSTYLVLHSSLNTSLQTNQPNNPANHPLNHPHTFVSNTVVANYVKAELYIPPHRKEIGKWTMFL